MRPEDNVRLQHLTEAATKAITYSSGKYREDLDDDELLRLALTKLVEIVGEAAKHVSPEILWQTVTQDLPQLVDALRPPSE
ncbi:MAG: hypothetical protein L0K86_15040 [Actinomycetia bacterium]|nr:hypothetical protein [Actinomycetes bacterium]